MQDKPQATMFGKLLNRVRAERKLAYQKAEQDLWKRNKLDNPAQREGYKIAETTTVYRDGREEKELRLYKLVDAAVVTINSEIHSTIENGTDKLRENNR